MFGFIKNAFSVSYSEYSIKKFIAKMLAMYGKARVGLAVTELAQALSLPIELFDDADTVFDASKFEGVITTPGVSPKGKVWSRAFKGNNTIAELDFAYRYLPPGFKIVAVTGTDGKSTTAWILYQILVREFGENKVFLSGNFDIPFSETVQNIRAQWLKWGIIVVEVSSFMSDQIGKNNEILAKLPRGEREDSFYADYTIFTNFEKDHLDWHGTIEKYWEAKMNLVRHSGQTIANSTLQNNAHTFKDTFPLNTKWYGEWHKDRTDGENIVISGRKKYLLSRTHFTWLHNATNILAATIVTQLLKVCSKRTNYYLQDIVNLPHRLELVTTKNWVQYIDDSKSTSAQSLRAALESFQKQNILLIAWGSNKWDEFSSLEPLFKQKLLYVAAIGATKDTFIQIAKTANIPHSAHETLWDAVVQLAQIAKPGDVVLLSPGCASFGLFKNYLERAEKFKQAVNLLPIEHE